MTDVRHHNLYTDSIRLQKKQNSKKQTQIKSNKKIVKNNCLAKNIILFQNRSRLFLNIDSRFILMKKGKIRKVDRITSILQTCDRSYTFSWLLFALKVHLQYFYWKMISSNNLLAFESAQDLCFSICESRPIFR
jgi:hypothetical protein